MFCKKWGKKWSRGKRILTRTKQTRFYGRSIMMSETTLGDKILVTKSYLFIVNQAVALFAQT